MQPGAFLSHTPDTGASPEAPAVQVEEAPAPEPSEETPPAEEEVPAPENTDESPAPAPQPSGRKRGAAQKEA